ncbi:ABC transporter ATP-binding protein [uncultured Roseobacter sp.]|uniref:ABC transporter ATP-binding protein n=1 Tax=uncultured Roseobacter sp. TaxID=114847 RepID=UPI002617EA2F|nr:ABC transporter ATP-binding protein [uncultured Roseobacter sp.]
MQYVYMSNFSVRAGESTILSRVQLRVDKPGLIVILGDSGSGKSSLAKALTGQLRPGQGSTGLKFKGLLSVLGRPIDEWGLPELGSEVGLVFQDPIMFPGTPWENLVEIPKLALRKPDPVLDNDELQALLKKYGLGQIDLGMNATDLSGGQRQRLAILRAVIMRPKMLVLDEVTSGLDDPVSLDIVRMIHAEAAEKPVILITHDTRLVAWASRVIVMNKGRVEFDGPAHEARASSAPFTVQRLLNAGDELANPRLNKVGQAPNRIQRVV